MGGAIVQHVNSSAELEKRAIDARPYYYIDHVSIEATDVQLTRNSWQIIMTSSNTLPYLEEIESHPQLMHSSLLTWFFEKFYDKFFSLCPEARNAFSAVSMVSQSRLMAGVISSSLGLLNRPVILAQRLVAMVIKHHQRGVRATQYSTMGEALLWTLAITLGDEFTTSVKNAWTRVYSHLLSIILPAAISAETNAVEFEPVNIKSTATEKHVHSRYK